MSDIFRRRKLSYDMIIRARFGTTVCALVRAGLGIAVIDQFTVAHGSMHGHHHHPDRGADPVSDLCRREERSRAFGLR